MLGYLCYVDSLGQQLTRVLGKDARQTDLALGGELGVNASTMRGELQGLSRGNIISDE